MAGRGSDEFTMGKTRLGTRFRVFVIEQILARRLAGSAPWLSLRSIPEASN